MRSGRILIFLALILIIGLIVAAVALPRVLPMLRPATPTVTVYQVYYALQNIAQGTIITEELLGTYTLPETSFADVMFTTAERSSLVGQKAKINIDQGVPITTGMIAPPETGLETGGPPWANLIAATKTAIAIPISRLTSVAYGISDGARVNVITCLLFVDVDPSFQSQLPNYLGLLVEPGFKPDQMPGITIGGNNSAFSQQVPPYQGRTELEPAFPNRGIYVVPSEAPRPRPVCQMIMQDIPILKLGNFPLNPEQIAANQPTPTPQPGSQQQTAAQAPDIVTLVVSPQEAVVLTYLIFNNAPLYLTLRNGGDRSLQVTESATLQFILSQHNITPPVKLAFSLTPRVDALTLPFLPNDVATVSPGQ